MASVTIQHLWTTAQSASQIKFAQNVIPITISFPTPTHQLSIASNAKLQADSSYKIQVNLFDHYFSLYFCKTHQPLPPPKVCYDCQDSCAVCTDIDHCSSCETGNYPKYYDECYLADDFKCVACDQDGEFTEDSLCKSCRTEWHINARTCSSTTITACDNSYYKYSSTANTVFDQCTKCNSPTNKPLDNAPTDGTGWRFLN